MRVLDAEDERCRSPKRSRCGSGREGDEVVCAHAGLTGSNRAREAGIAANILDILLPS